MLVAVIAKVRADVSASLSTMTGHAVRFENGSTHGNPLRLLQVVNHRWLVTSKTADLVILLASVFIHLTLKLIRQGRSWSAGMKT